MLFRQVVYIFSVIRSTASLLLDRCYRLSLAHGRLAFSTISPLFLDRFGRYLQFCQLEFDEEAIGWASVVLWTLVFFVVFSKAYLRLGYVKILFALLGNRAPQGLEIEEKRLRFFIFYFCLCLYTIFCSVSYFFIFMF